MTAASIRPHHPSARELSELCAAFGLEAEGDVDQVELTGVTSHSERVEAGDLFVALPGRHRHGADFAADAVERGAVAVLTDEAGAERARAAGVPLVVVEEPRLGLGPVAGWVYRTDTDAVRLLGVTGARGKTAVVDLIGRLLDLLGDEIASSSSTGLVLGDEAVDSDLTTPEADTLHAFVARMRERDARVGAVEVTPHGLREERLAGLEFEVVGFVSFAPEMLAEGVSPKATLRTMLELFAPEHARRGVVSIDGKWGRRVVEETRIPVTTVATKPSKPADWQITATPVEGGRDFTVVGLDGREVRTRVWCDDEFSIANLGLAIVMLEESGLDLEQVQEALDRAGGLDLTQAREHPRTGEITTTDR